MGFGKPLQHRKLSSHLVFLGPGTLSLLTSNFFSYFSLFSLISASYDLCGLSLVWFDNCAVSRKTKMTQYFQKSFSAIIIMNHS